MDAKLPCREVVFERRGLSRNLIGLGALFMLLVLPAAAMLGWVGAIAGLGSAIFCWVMAESVAKRRRAGGTLTLATHSLLVVDGTGEPQRIAMTEILSGFEAPTQRAAILELRGGSQLTLMLREDGDAARVLAHAGVGIAQRTLTLRLRHMLGPFTIGLLSFGPLLVLAIGMGITFIGTLGLLIAPLALLVAAFFTSLVVWRFGFPRIVVGADGIRLLGTLRERFVPHDNVAGVETVHSLYENTSPSLRVRLRRGAPFTLPTVAAPPERIEGLAQRIRDASAAHASGGARPLEALGRGARSIDVWKTDVARMALAPPGFREHSLGKDDFEKVLADAAAAPDQRIGAALALRALDPAEGALRIRIAADASADEALRDALASAAEGEIDDEALERVTSRKSVR